jgi:hypothetical protein
MNAHVEVMVYVSRPRVRRLSAAMERDATELLAVLLTDAISNGSGHPRGGLPVGAPAGLPIGSPLGPRVKHGDPGAANIARQLSAEHAPAPLRGGSQTLCSGFSRTRRTSDESTGARKHFPASTSHS